MPYQPRSHDDEDTAFMQPKTIGLLIAGVILFVLILMFGIPIYNVWTSRLSGEAALAHATYARQVLVAQAEAEKDAAILRAQAIGIVGKAAKEYPEYREQEFIGAFAEALKDGKIGQIIYVPTEANIPIIEAGKRQSTTEHQP